MAETAGVTLPTLPWHIANFWWNFDKPVEKFTSLEIDITIDRDVPSGYTLGNHSAVVEVYSTAKNPKSGIPKANVSFSALRVNGSTPPLTKVSACYHNQGGPDSPDCSRMKKAGESYVVEVDPIFKRDEAQRRRDLPLKP